MSEENTISLFEKVIKDDETAFRLLFERYSRRMFHLAYYFLHSRESSEEVVLDVFTNIWNKRASLSHVKDPERYLYIAVKNQALHYLRRGYVQESDYLSLYEIELLPESNTPEEKLLDTEYQTLIQKAIDSLPPKCQEVFRLVLADKLKNREIAELLGISEKTVNEHIAKAYKRISEYVNKQYKSTKNIFLFLFY
ncbi:RNA polymerase sigma-70 factor [uncultured Parabacteroides sp.]|uniref:RNA polymerase sigma-70 factor n=1 Tax=uncultured Parabacteroides sp. TaxID=512312 RepID=UPI00258D7BC5|nr:RNA polymerase sigma-70 factor [uncultured Parabacteroides sp.]